MIALIIWLIICLAWLGYETNWMRVRLFYGAPTPVIECQYKTWDKLKPWDIKKTDVGWLRFPNNIAPLTGWDWLRNTLHIVPEYTIELVGAGYRTTIHSQSASALRDAMRVNRNPYIKVKI